MLTLADWDLVLSASSDLKAVLMFLAWVLTFFNSMSYEPQSLAPFHRVTEMAVFLWALTTAARVSELHAESADLVFLWF